MAAHVRTTLLRTPLRGNPAWVRLEDGYRRYWGISHDRHSLQGPSPVRFPPALSRMAPNLCVMPGFGHELTVHTAATRRPGRSQEALSQRGVHQHHVVGRPQRQREVKVFA